MPNTSFNPTNNNSKILEEKRYSFIEKSPFVTQVKSLFVKEEYGTHKTVFLDKIKTLSKKYKLGNVSYNISYDEAGFPEKIISIKVPEYKSVEEANEAHFKIIEEMELFSKQDSKMSELFMDSYIVLDY